MKKRILWATLAGMLFVAGCASAPKKVSGPQNNPNYKGKGGETKQVTVKGLAQITSSGDQDAYNKAVEQGMRKAVEVVLGSLVKSETMVKNSVLVEDKIYSKSAGFVQKYEVLSQTKDGGTMIVEMKADVVLGEVKDDAMSLGLLQDRVNRPKVIVLVDEKSLTDGKDLGIARSTLQQIMMDKQFEFVDEGQLQKVLAARNIQLSKLTGVSANDMAAIAVDAGAQIILKGAANSSKQDLSGSGIPENWKSARTSFTLDAIYAADASILASSSSTKAAALIDLESAQKKSIETAAKAVADDVINKIIKKWDDFVNNGFEYDVIVAGVDFNTSSEVQSGMEKNIEGVKKVFDKGFNDANKTQTFLVRYSGTPRELARAMIAAGKISVALKVDSVTSKSILLSVKK